MKERVEEMRAAGKKVCERGRQGCRLQDSGKFKVRYSTLGFQHDANLDTATCGRSRSR